MQYPHSIDSIRFCAFLAGLREDELDMCRRVRLYATITVTSQQSRKHLSETTGYIAKFSRHNLLKKECVYMEPYAKYMCVRMNWCIRRFKKSVQPKTKLPNIVVKVTTKETKKLTHNSSTLFSPENPIVTPLMYPSRLLQERTMKMVPLISVLALE